MYKVPKPNQGTMRGIKTVEGETLEQKVDRIMQQGEPIEDGAPLIYTEESDGVLPEHNIRTDRFEFAVKATDYLTKQKLAKKDGTPINNETGTTDTTGSQKTDTNEQ